jgi:GntR family transcriptional repressor for pyruvate dehydrogenase complex
MHICEPLSESVARAFESAKSDRGQEAALGAHQMQLDYTSVVTSSVAKQISEQIREAILNGQLEVGQRLPTEDDLAQKYGVSRPTIREALKRLAAQNLIRSRRGPTGGNFVAVPNPASYAESITGTSTLLVSLGAFDFDEIAKARFEMEAICCKLAAQNWQSKDMEAIEAAFADLSDPQISDEEFCAADVRFHRAIVDATSNGPIRFVMFAVIEALLPVTNLVVFRVRERKTVIGFHERILAGLRKREAAPAIEALGELIEYLRQQYTRSANGQNGRRIER